MNLYAKYWVSITSKEGAIVSFIALSIFREVLLKAFLAAAT